MKHSPRELAAHYHTLSDRISNLPREAIADYTAAVQRGDKDARKNPIYRWQLEMEGARRTLAALPGVSDRMVLWNVEIGGPVDSVNQFRFQKVVDRIQAGEDTEDDQRIHDALMRGEIPGDKTTMRIAEWLGEQKDLLLSSQGVAEKGWFHVVITTSERKAKMVEQLAHDFKEELAEGRLRLLCWADRLEVLAPQEYPEAWPWGAK